MRTTIVLLAVTVVSAASPSATTLVPADVGELSRDARAIVVGRVTAVEPRWTPDRRAIETLVTLQADAYLKGSLGLSVQFLVPGGVLGRFQNIVVGAPRLAEGERIVVFLGARGPSLPFILGLSQGLYRVVLSDRTWVVTPPALLPGASTATPIARGDPRRRPMALDEFTDQVRLLAEPQR
jgi:hypothetical protein